WSTCSSQRPGFPPSASRKSGVSATPAILSCGACQFASNLFPTTHSNRSAKYRLTEVRDIPLSPLVSQSNSTSVTTLNFNPPALRWLLLLPAGIALVLACVAMRWYVGNTIAEYAPPADEGGLEMAQVAVRWAPDDPLTHWRLAVFEEKTF